MPRHRVVRRPQSERVQIYLQPSVPQERMLLDVIEAGKDMLRMSDFVRRTMLEGFKVMLARGEVPPELLAQVPAAAHLAETLGAAPLAGHVPPSAPRIPHPPLAPRVAREPAPKPAEPQTAEEVADLLGDLM